MAVDPVFKVKKMFLDQKKIQKLMDRKTLRAMNRYGGLLRKIAQRSMRSRKGSQRSGEGKPPYAHGRRLLRKMLFYSYNPQTQKLVTGPVKLNVSNAPVPRLMERGGTFTRISKNAELVHLNYGGNPFMEPAMEQTIAKLPGFYR